MNKLISANFMRLRKGKLFWIIITFMFGMGIFVSCSKYYQSVRFEEPVFFDDALFVYISILGFCSAIFCSLYTGTEYSDGTIRNKLISGHDRRHIYLSNLIVNTAAAWLMTAAFLFSYTVLASFLLERPAASVKTLIFYIVISLFAEMSFASVFTILAMLISRKSLSAVWCMLVFLGLFTMSMTLWSRLAEPEVVSEYQMTVNGIEQTKPTPNPLYLSPNARNICGFMMDVLPTGQGLQLSAFEVRHPFLMILYSIAVSGILTFLGILLFRKKNLN